MPHPLHDIAIGADPPDVLNAFIEIPRGSRNKYELHKETGFLKLDRLLYSAVHYPGDYGFIPQTLGDDGDALDILVLTTEPTFPGCIVEVRPVGVFMMEDEKGDDEKILAVPLADPMRQEVFELSDLPAHLLEEIRHFFTVYKDLEGKRVHTTGWEGKERARQVVLDCVERYRAHLAAAD